MMGYHTPKHRSRRPGGLLLLAEAVVQQQLDDFVKYPPRQKAASFNLDTVMAQLGPAMAAEKAEEAKKAKKVA
jgi:hypothetical protein